ncbi:hypothetical protein ACH3XW_40170 [Acanthocheilonema viteae]
MNLLPRSPRLELLSVLIGVRAGQFVLKQLQKQPHSTTLWSDSTCVLYWITNYTKLLPRFVQSRVDEIRSSKFNMRYIPSQHNPADIATRGLSLSHLRNCKQWWIGLHWLSEPESKWPTNRFNYTGRDEFGQAIIMALTTENNQTLIIKSIEFIDIQRFSRLERLVRTTVWALRFIKQTCHKKLPMVQSLSLDRSNMTAQDYEVAEQLLIRQVQSQCVTMDEKEKWSLFKSTTDNLWRSWSRLASPDGRFPIYLSKSHHFTKLIIQNQHEKLIHAGTTHTLSQIRRRFWIPKGRAAVKSVISKALESKTFQATSHARSSRIPDHKIKSIRKCWYRLSWTNHR